VAVMIGFIILWSLMMTWYSGKTFKKYMEG